MGIRFRKSINVGPARVNFSKSGIGTSIGTKGFRKTRTANGTKRTTASMPGTGVSWVSSDNKEKKDMAKKKSIVGPIIGIVLAIGVIGAVAGGGEEKAPAEPSRVIAETAAAETTAATTATEALATIATVEATQPQEKEHSYVLNTSSKKFHVPSCSSVGKIADNNKEEFTGLRSDLIERGYDPCGNCNP